MNTIFPEENFPENAPKGQTVQYSEMSNNKELQTDMLKFTAA